MTQTLQTAARTFSGQIRRAPGFLQSLVIWHAAWAERRRMSRLDDAARRDMGLSETSAMQTGLRDIAERIERTY